MARFIADFVARRLTAEYARFVGIVILSISGLMLTLMFATEDGGRTVLGPGLGGDFQGPYVAGWIFNHVSPADAYDLTLHTRKLHELFPNLEPSAALPFMGAPFLLPPFVLLARLPYQWAYLVWVLLSLALYAAGFTLLWRTLKFVPPESFVTALLLALSFEPVFVDSIAGGQTSAVGFFCLAGAISLERRGKPVLAGALLALCWYKLTFLVLIGPMLLVTKRGRTFAGFVLGSAAAAGIAVLTVGWKGCANYVDLLRYLSSLSTGAETGLRKIKYVDINSFARLLFGAHTGWRTALVAAVICAIVPFLLRFWRHGERGGAADQALMWAATVTWTVVLNVYWGLYDAVVIIVGVLLTTEFLYAQTRALPLRFKYILAAVYVLPWFTQPMALRFGLQIFTLGLTALGIYQLRLRFAEPPQTAL